MPAVAAGGRRVQPMFEVISGMVNNEARSARCGPRALLRRARARRGLTRGSPWRSAWCRGSPCKCSGSSWRRDHRRLPARLRADVRRAGAAKAAARRGGAASAAVAIVRRGAAARASHPRRGSRPGTPSDAPAPPRAVKAVDTRQFAECVWQLFPARPRMTDQRPGGRFPDSSYVERGWPRSASFDPVPQVVYAATPGDAALPAARAAACGAPRRVAPPLGVGGLVRHPRVFVGTRSRLRAGDHHSGFGRYLFTAAEASPRRPCWRRRAGRRAAAAITAVRHRGARAVLGIAVLTCPRGTRERRSLLGPFSSRRRSPRIDSRKREEDLTPTMMARGADATGSSCYVREPRLSSDDDAAATITPLAR